MPCIGHLSWMQRDRLEYNNGLRANFRIVAGEEIDMLSEEAPDLDDEVDNEE